MDRQIRHWRDEGARVQPSEGKTQWRKKNRKPLSRARKNRNEKTEEEENSKKNG